jgi:hypothetical protein
MKASYESSGLQVEDRNESSWKGASEGVPVVREQNMVLGFVYELRDYV